jgi:Ca2+-binding RTX toxin-like protein/subtilisin family serine protease
MTTPSRLPDDLKGTLAKDQWWLLNKGQRVENNNVTPGTPGIDLNVVPLWPFYTGKDIKVGVIDDGVEGNHEDLAGNFNQSLSLPDSLGGPFPATGQNDHGTAVAGIIAARRNNLGTVGIAYEATIASYKYSDTNGSAVPSLEAQAELDVSNNSWGGSTHFQVADGNFKINNVPGKAIQNAVTIGRGGLGTVFAWSGGNERGNVNPTLAKAQQRGRNVNSGNYENNRYVIAVAAIDNNGVVASYSNPGAPLLVSAFGEEGSVVTVDLTGNDGNNTYRTATEGKNFPNPNYINDFNGTSSAAPMVSGVAALILQANPNLGYRDVQEILAYSARKNDPDNQSVASRYYADGKIPKDTWTFNGAKNWNGGGLHVNHDYGFGLVDATAAVRLAETWLPRSGTAQNEAATAANEKSQLVNLTLPESGVDIPNNNPAGINQTFKITQGINIDKLELDLNIEHGQFQDLVVKLTSPDNTESVILDRVPYYTETAVESGIEDRGFKGTTLNYTFSSARHWGETGLGDWTLNISDNSATNDPINSGQPLTYQNQTIPTSGNNIGKLKGATLRLYGDDLINDNTYIYTNEFASFTDEKDATRKTLSDTNDGNDIINVAAITDNVIVNLAPGGTSTLPGRTVTGQELPPQTLTIAPGSIIENVFAGEGNDSIVGNEAVNTLIGFNGNDTLVASGAGDTLIGFSGSDSLVGGSGDTTYILDATTATGSRIKNVGGAGNNLILNNATLTKTLAVGQNGIGQKGNNLLIDLNADGELQSRFDLTIEDFFLPSSGRFQNVGNLLGSDILPVPTPPTPETPTPTPGIILETFGNDALEGSAQNDTIDGLGGDQEIFGGAGNDSLSGDDGDDYLNGEEGDDSLFGGAGNDYLDDELGNNLLSGGDGDDAVLGGSGADTLTGDAGDDYLNGDKGNDSLIGGAGNDILVDEFGNNLLSGGDGDDEVFGGSGADTLTGDAGDDSLFGYEGNDSISGGVGSDVADGGDGNDTLEGGDDNDELSGGEDNDSINGGLGNDELYGDDGNDTLTGGGGADSLAGGIGDDLYLLDPATAGNSVIADDSGNDTLTLNGLTLAIGLAAGRAGVTRDDEFGTDLLIDLNKDGEFELADDLLIFDFFAEPNLDQGYGFIEQVGNLSGADILNSFPLKATPEDDFLGGGSGDDNIDGLAGNDKIDGDQGNDSLFGNAGNDVLNGDELLVISEAGGDVILGTGIGNDYLDGGDGNDILDGGEGDDTLLGAASNDSLWGGEGADNILGNDGEDLLFGNAGNDFVEAGKGNDIFYGGKGADGILGGGGNDSLYANQGLDVVVGGEGNDIIFGGKGDDTLAGIDASAINPGIGEFDNLTGGEGNDLFFLGNSEEIYYSGDGNAVISDFNSAEDAIVLSGIKDNYSLSVSGNATSIFVKKPGESDDLIATVQGVMDLNLDQPYFTFI